MTSISLINVIKILVSDMSCMLKLLTNTYNTLVSNLVTKSSLYIYKKYYKNKKNVKEEKYSYLSTLHRSDFNNNLKHIVILHNLYLSLIHI